jgi:hypothetical protein
MKLFNIFITACFVIAAAQAVAAAVAMLIVLALIYGLFVHPRPTLGVFALLVSLGMFEAHPIAFVVTAASLAVIATVRAA